MLNLRESTFETNSSSSHSITFSTEGSAKLGQHNFTICLRGDDYGWEFRFYGDPQNKFSYWLNAFVENNGLILSRKCAEKFGIEGQYYITNRLEGKNQGPADKEVYTTFLYEVADKLKAVLKALEDCGVSFHPEYTDPEELSSWDFNLDEYIDAFIHKNLPTTVDKLCSSEFDYLVELGYGIDHQSSPREDSDCEKLAEFSPEQVVDWVLGDGSFETGNDNN